MNRDHALALAKKGFKVFLLKANEKTPLVADFPNVATNDLGKVASMWTDPFGESRYENIGVSTDSLLVLDFDAKVGRDLVEKEFATYTKFFGLKHAVMTAGGGYHVYTRLPKGVRCAGKVKIEKLGKSIDTRSFHNYVVAPGSSINHMPYTWLVTDDGNFVEPSSVEDLPFAHPEIIAACGAPVERAAKQLDIDWDTPAALSHAKAYLLDNAPGCELGARGSTAYKVACRVRDFGVSDFTCLELMLDNWNHEPRVMPQMPLDDLNESVQHAYQYAKGVPRAPGSEFEAVDIGNPISEPVSAKGAKSKNRIQQESFDEACENAISLIGKPLVKGLIDYASVLAIYGQANAGKSFLAIELGRCVAMGEPFAGRATEKGAVLYFGLESPQGLRRRFAVIRKHKTDGASIPMSLYSGRINLLEGEADVAVIIEEIGAAEKKYGIPVKLIIIDTLTKAALGAQLNDDRDMSMVLKRAETIRDTTGVCVGIVHHAGKDLARGMKGSTAIRESVDVALSVEADKRKPGTPGTGKIVVNKERDSDYVADIPFVLEPKCLWTDPDTLEVYTSCVVEFPVGSRVREEKAAAKERDRAETVAEILIERGIANGQSLRWKEVKGQVSERLGITLDTLQKWTNDQPSGVKLFAGVGRKIEFKKLSGNPGSFIKLLLDDKLSSEIDEIESDIALQVELPAATGIAELNAELNAE